MKPTRVREGIYWVGAIDWSIRSFHGYATDRGTTYGAYLILDEKITLIDTVKSQFTEEMLARISEVVNPEEIEVIIVNHVEMDHSGALPLLLKRCPKAAVYTSGMSGIRGLTMHYGDHNYLSVKSGETISIGRRNLTFVATPMLHWPDNMLTYCPEEKILFSNDAFGQHLAGEERFDEEAGLDLALEEAKKYYANIIMCYGKQAQTAWKMVRELPLTMIAPSHGIIWKKHTKEIIKSYETWSKNEPSGGAVVVFDSMWNSTEKMARQIAETFHEAGIKVSLYDLKKNHYSNIMPDILTSRYLAVGSPTLNNQMLPTVSAFLTYLKGLSPTNREAFAFGSYGWGGQACEQIQKELEQCGFSILLEKIRIQYIPDQAALSQMGELLAGQIG